MLSIPKLFDIRWSAFTYTLINNVLHSWQALVAFFKQTNNDAEASGFLNYLTNERNLKMLAFVADILQIFQRCHKKVQSNDLTIVSLVRHLELLQKSLDSLKGETLLGGWEEALDSEIVVSDDERHYLKKVELDQSG